LLSFLLLDPHLITDSFGVLLALVILGYFYFNPKYSPKRKT